MAQKTRTYTQTDYYCDTCGKATTWDLEAECWTCMRKRACKESGHAVDLEDQGYEWDNGEENPATCSRCGTTVMLKVTITEIQ